MEVGSRRSDAERGATELLQRAHTSAEVETRDTLIFVFLGFASDVGGQYQPGRISVDQSTPSNPAATTTGLPTADNDALRRTTQTQRYRLERTRPGSLVGEIQKHGHEFDLQRSVSILPLGNINRRLRIARMQSFLRSND